MNCTWIIHCVFDETTVAYHTHGLKRYGSPELELNLPLEQKQAGMYINLIAEQISKGKRYISGDKETEIFTLPFYLLETRPIFGEKNELVLRIVFPDPQVKYPWDGGCEPIYANQLSFREILLMKRLLQYKER